ncbi:MAG: IgGFc-binding protein [Labilithrix sp.]|nr:IgGFc-binding protein [Labilithrix sp.]
MSRRLAMPATISVFGFAFVAAVFACEGGRGAFDNGPSGFDPLPEEDAGECLLQCSLDGRSVIRSCTGDVVETCPSELACGDARCQEACAAAAANSSSNGCEFYFQPPPEFEDNSDSCYAAFVVNTSASPVEISLGRGGEELDLSGAIFRTTSGDATLIQHTGPIPPDESVVVFISDHDPEVPRGSRSHLPCPAGVRPAVLSRLLGLSPPGTRFGSSFHLTSNAPVSLVAMYPFGGAESRFPSATLLMPVVTWAKEHVLVDGWEASKYGNPASRIVASEDGTEITIIAKKSLQDGIDVQGGPANTPLKYTLEKGEYLQLQQSDELVGSIVMSSKPTSISGGNSCAYVPSWGGACDILWQQIPSFEQWGSEYVGVGYRQRTSSPHELMPYRIVAAHDGTRLDYDPVIPPGAPTEMNAGDFVTFPVSVNAPFVVRTQDAAHPIYVAAYMQGKNGGYHGSPPMADQGDPEFVNVVPAGQWQSSYSFYADPTYEETSLVVIRGKQRDKFEDVWLECAGTLEGWTPIGTRGDYEFVRVDLQRDGGPGQAFGDKVCQTGLHRMKSEGPFHRHDLGLGPCGELRLSRRHGAPEARRRAAAPDPVTSA